MNKFLTFILTALFILNFSVHIASAEEILTWADCVKEAAKNHPDLISASESVKQSEASKKITRSALFPQIDASVDSSAARASGKTTDTYSYGVSANQLLFDGLKTIENVKAASENIKSAQYNYKFTSTEVRLKLRTAFINLLKSQELLQVAEEIVHIRRDSLILITLRYESGLEHKGALLTAEANAAEANFELSRARRDVELAQRQLTKEMGRFEFQPMSVKGDFDVSDSAREKPDFNALVKDNPLLLGAVFKKNAAAFGIRSAYADFSPQVLGKAGADKTDSHWPPENDKWNVGLSVTMPIFEGGSRLAAVSKAQAAYNQLQADERSTRDSLIVGLQETWASLQDAIETVEVGRKSLEAAQVRSKIAEAQYSTGFINFDNWIIIQNDLVNAKKTFLNVRANALLAEANWIQAKGETLEYAQK
ncbi:MAG: TolC family protein [Candidatus Omnitrophota bacterium]